MGLSLSTSKSGENRNNCNAHAPYNTCAKSVFLRPCASIVGDLSTYQTYQNCIHCAKHIHHVYYLSFIVSTLYHILIRLSTPNFRPPGREMRGYPRTRTQREEWGIVSHIIPYCFNPWGTGSHLYTANANTLRSVHRNKDLLALVGTHLSWSPCPPLLCFHYSTHSAICQALFCQVLYFSEKILGENLVAIFPIGWGTISTHPCGTGKGFSVGCPSHSR
jgi:hypothetical protein